jgi:hypothetical protein
VWRHAAERVYFWSSRAYGVELDNLATWINVEQILGNEYDLWFNELIK